MLAKREAKRYIDEVYSGAAEAYMCEVDIAEFLYNYARVFGWEAALAKHSLIRSSPIEIIGLNKELTVNAARLKLKYYNILSLADCYLVALAKQKKACIVSTDGGVKKVEGVRTIVLSIEHP